MKYSSYSNVVDSATSIAPTVVSAVISDIRPWDIDITFNAPLRATSVPATSAFTIAGKTISAVAIAGSVVTISVTVPYVITDSGVQVGYTKPALNPLLSFYGTAGTPVATFSNRAVTNGILHPAILQDSNTVLWVDKNYGITADVNNHVTAWADKSGLNHHLSNVTGTPHKTATGVLFDGVGDSLKANAFTLGVPEYIYIVVKLSTPGWLFDGNTKGTGIGYWSGTAKSGLTLVYLRMNNGAQGPDTDLQTIMNEYFVARFLFNAGSVAKCTINDNAFATGVDLTTSMGGFTIGGSGGADNFFGGEIAEVIVRKAADSDANSDAIYNYLHTKYGIRQPFFSKGLVLFSFDDGYAEYYQGYKDVFGATGTKATLFITNAGGSVLTETQLHDLIDNYGCDVKCHSFDHPNMDTLTPAQNVAQMVANNAAFVAKNLPEPDIIAYPQGRYSRAVITAIAPYRKMGRSVSGFVDDEGFTVPAMMTRFCPIYKLPAGRCDPQDYPADVANMKVQIDHAALYKLACFPYAHTINQASIIELIAYAQTKNVDIITFTELYPLMEHIV
jgi:peptidoglycan/xylan/chitin deacetylase (PgdA/CDA1 family)